MRAIFCLGRNSDLIMKATLPLPPSIYTILIPYSLPLFLYMYKVILLFICAYVS